MKSFRFTVPVGAAEAAKDEQGQQADLPIAPAAASSPRPDSAGYPHFARKLQLRPNQQENGGQK